MGAELRSAKAPAIEALVIAALVIAAPGAAGCSTFAGETLRGAGGEGGATATSSTGDGGAGGGGSSAEPNAVGALLPVLDAAHVCSLLGECPALGPSLVASMGLPVIGVADGATDLRFSACLEWLASPLAEGRIGFEQQQEILFCVAASSCEGALACLPAQIVGEADPRCEAGDPGARCEGETRVACPAGIVIDCGPPLFGPGSSCVEVDAEVAVCGIDAGCAEPLRCDGSFAVRCDASGVLVTLDCAAVGLSCNASAEAAGGCATEEGPRPCEQADFGESSCSADGERVYTCTGTTDAQIDCAALGLACATEGLSARCASPSEACTPYDVGVDTCEGSVLRGCVGGAPVEIDCAALGRTCAEASEGPTGSLSGRCRRQGE